MGKIKATQKVTIKFHAENENIAMEFESYINGEYEGIAEFELNVDGDTEYRLIALEEAEGWYDPPVYYTKNGDGFPGCKEIDYEIWEDDLREVCKEFADRYDDENVFVIDSILFDEEW